MSDFKKTEFGLIPNEWELEDINSIASKNLEDSFTDGDWIESKNIVSKGIRLIQTGNIGIGHFKEKNSKKYITEQTFEELNCKEVKEGDILICRLADPIGRSCIVPALGTKNITSVDVAILKPDSKNYDRHFINYTLSSTKTLNKVKAFASGTTRQRISRKNLGAIRLPIPPLKEQQKIAAILSSVDEAIEKTEQIIEQTETVKKGLMQQLLTKGIGHTEFKESSIGKIPITWEVVDLIEVADPEERNSFVGGPFGSDLTSKEYTDDGVRIIQLQNIGDGQFNDEYRIYTTESKADELLKCNIFPGDIIIAKMAEPVARACIIPDFHNRYLMASDGIRLKVNENQFDRDFILHAINSPYFRNQAISNSTGTTRLRIGLKTLRGLKIGVPPLEEQIKISNIIDNIEIKIKFEEKKVEKLKRIKQGLMQQLLTGKVRVPINEDEEVPS